MLLGCPLCLLLLCRCGCGGGGLPPLRPQPRLSSLLHLQLPAYGVLIVHAGLVPGLPLERQALFDMEKMWVVMA